MDRGRADKRFVAGAPLERCAAREHDRRRSHGAAMEGPGVTTDNPYKAPTAPVKDALPPPRSPIVAVLAGLAVDIGGTVVAGIVIAIVYAIILASQGLDAEKIQTVLSTVDPSSTYFAVGTLMGFGFSVLGGYVCARLARRRERRLALIQGLLSAAIGLSMAGDDFEIGVNIGMSLLTALSVVLGGELGRRRNLAVAHAKNAA